MQKAVPLNKVKPNPFRNMQRYPIDEAKITQLTESYDATGFWGNIVGREVNGDVEIAYGHHRLVALERKHGENSRKPVDIIIRDLDDEQMLKIMASENMEDWGTNAKVAEETVRATVEAFAAGRIRLPQPSKDTKRQYFRIAPGFLAGGGIDVFTDSKHVYTAETLGQFLGWIYPSGQVKPVLRVALDTLEAQERNLIKEEHTSGLTRDQARVVTQGALKIRRSYDAAAKLKPNPTAKKQLTERGAKVADRFAKDAGRKMKQGAGVREVEREAMTMKADTPKRIPNIEEFAETTTRHLNAILNRDDTKAERINTIIEYRKHLPSRQREQLVIALTNLAKRCEAFCDKLNKE